jgi:hypothetical protein
MVQSLVLFLNAHFTTYYLNASVYDVVLFGLGMSILPPVIF